MTDQPDPKSPRLLSVVGPLLELIPGVGGVLSATWSEWDTGRRFRRVEQTIVAIVKKLSGQSIKDLARSDLGMQLLELVLREAQVQHSQAKREQLANIIVCAWISESPPEAVFDESTLFLRATAMFGEGHIVVIDKLHEAGLEGSVAFQDLSSLIKVAPDTATDRDEATLTILNDLCSALAFVRRSWDLNQPDAKSGLLRTGSLSPEGIARKCFHAITPRGNRYFQHVVRGEPTQ